MTTRNALDDLLHLLLAASCEVPLAEVKRAADEAGVRPSDILKQAEDSDRCYVDYETGFVRCLTQDWNGFEEEDEEDAEAS